MNLTTTQDGTTFHARIAERLAFSDHKAFRELLKQVSASGAKTCVFDLSQLNSIDSAGLGMFVVAHEEGQANGWSLVVRGAKGHVDALMKLGKFDKILTLEEA
jgi:anti-anti-sigma factor